MAAAVRLNTVLICRLPRRDIVPQRARGRRSPSCLRSGDGRPPLVSHRRSFLLHHHQTAARPSVRPRQLANLTRFHSPFSSYPSFSRSHPFPFRAPDSAGLTPEEQIEPRRKVALKFEAHNRGNTGIVTAVSEIRSCSSICGNAFEIGTRGAADSQSQVSLGLGRQDSRGEEKRARVFCVHGMGNNEKTRLEWRTDGRRIIEPLQQLRGFFLSESVLCSLASV